MEIRRVRVEDISEENKNELNDRDRGLVLCQGDRVEWYEVDNKTENKLKTVLKEHYEGIEKSTKVQVMQVYNKAIASRHLLLKIYENENRRYETIKAEANSEALNSSMIIDQLYVYIDTMNIERASNNIYKGMNKRVDLVICSLILIIVLITTIQSSRIVWQAILVGVICIVDIAGNIIQIFKKRRNENEEGSN